MSGRADIDNLVLATVLALGVPLENKSYRDCLRQAAFWLEVMKLRTRRRLGVI